MKRRFAFIAITIVVVILILSASGKILVAPKPTALPVQVPTAFPTKAITPTATASPEPVPSPTPDNQKMAIEAAWAIQKPLIDATTASVFNNKVTSPWLGPVFNITTLIPDSAATHCQAMKLWDNFIRIPDSLTGCSAGHDPITDYFGITTIPLETKENDNFVLKVFFFRPLPFCDSQRCLLVPAPGSAYYNMYIGSYYHVVSTCKKPTGTPTTNSLYQLLPYLNDPVSMTIRYSDTYIEIVANRGAWFSFGWESGEGWGEAFQFCPSP